MYACMCVCLAVHEVILHEIVVALLNITVIFKELRFKNGIAKMQWPVFAVHNQLQL